MKPGTIRADAAHGLLAAVGNTPLIELPFVAEVAPRARLFAKLESVNPGGSIKDRPVARMLTRAIAAGRFENGRRLLDSSSGNAGISYAMLGAALGVPVTIVVPGNASQERLERIRAHGAELVITDPIEGYDFALREAHRLAAEHPERYWHCDQYANEDNWLARTGGTLTGLGRRLREERPDLFIAAAIPETFPGIEGLKPLGHPGDIVPKLLDVSLIDERIEVSLDEAVAMCKRLTRFGLFVGPSSGAFVHAAIEIARRGKHSLIVTVLSDTGERYGSTGMWGSPAGATRRREAELKPQAAEIR
ncbi:MAG: PLP-dependent cysteine synthase family protein [Betaproteobacteria bacterium]|nr:PLP-dependent cysteine synthase family protein [Betaproteobacteria bacterium]